MTLTLDIVLSDIADIDKALDAARALYLSAPDYDSRAKARGQIDELLDKRLVLMRRRDDLYRG